MGLLQCHRRSRDTGSGNRRGWGKALGRAEGARENAVKVAIKLKFKKTPIDEIADLTDLSIEEINKL